MNNQMDDGIGIIKFNEDFMFCQGELGKNDFTPFLKSLPKIDFVYAALPKPEFLGFWYSMVPQEKIAHGLFMEGLCGILKFLDAKEYHIEVGESNKKPIMDFFENWNEYNHYYEQKIRYSAPIHAKTNGIAKAKRVTEILAFTKEPVDFPQVEFSHEYVEKILRRPYRMNCFDPVIGKGLLVREASKNNHSCFGIDMNLERLQCTIEFLEFSNKKGN